MWHFHQIVIWIKCFFKSKIRFQKDKNKFFLNCLKKTSFFSRFIVYCLIVSILLYFIILFMLLCYIWFSYWFFSDIFFSADCHEFLSQWRNVSSQSQILLNYHWDLSSKIKLSTVYHHSTYQMIEKQWC